jgi:hypothetical protein
MPANPQKPATQSPASPRNTAKYTNKDGSKFITVPKTASADASRPSTPTATKPTEAPAEPTAPQPPLPTVNRKKQKRRQKAAAKAAAEQGLNGHLSPVSSASRSQKTTPAYYEEVPSEEEDDEYDYVLEPELTNGNPGPDSKSKRSKKKKKKKNATSVTDDRSSVPSNAPPNSHATLAVTGGSGMSRDKIWSTSNQEERERIKEFWLGLGEDERKSLVKVEKDAVLKKMKEQQKHTCSCTVCGRKRTAIEEELETLYDAYYQELEQYAHNGEAPTILGPPSNFPLHSFGRPRPGVPSNYSQSRPPGRIIEQLGDDDEDEEGEVEEIYSGDELEDDEYSDEEPPEEYHSPHDPHNPDMSNFLTFGNSLQVKGTQLLESLLLRYGNMELGGILTVADDLLKNDGKRFIEMMEQLAERRMAREEDAREHFSRGYAHPNGSYSAPHNHPPPEDDEFDEEDEEEEDYEDSQDEEYEEEEVYSSPSIMSSRPHTECCCQDTMTEEQRMEEGRRMFQIFAARMFEQRVLSAYKEKVAKERQAKLLEELDEENRKEDEQKAKRAKNAQRKKEKAAEKKRALAEEKARKEAEKAAQEAARLEAEQQKAAEQRQKAEERRRQKEAQKKAEEEARLKKEAERQRRVHAQREKQAEQERKAREAKEREKKLKEEQRLKEKEAREQKEREALERKEKQERDKREKEARAAKAQKEAQEAKEAREKAKEELLAQKTAAQPPQQPQASSPASKRGQQGSVPVPTVLPQHPANPASYASPKVPVATPAISKPAAPIRPRTLSQQRDSAHQSTPSSLPSSVPSQEASPHPESTTQASPRPIDRPRKESNSVPGSMPLPTQTSSSASGVSSLPGQSTPVHMPQMGMQPPPGLAHHPPPPPGFPGRMGHEPMLPPGFRPSPSMMIPPPPGINGLIGRGFSPAPMPPPGFPQSHGEPFTVGQGFPRPNDAPAGPHTHNRQGSAGYDSPVLVAQPIGRPTPIGRPGSTSHGRARDNQDDEAQHLGSRALLDDDEPLASDINPGSFRTQPPGPRAGFAPSHFVDTGLSLAHNPWGPPAGASAFGPPGLPGPTWGSPSIPPAFNMAPATPGFSAGARMNPSSVPAIRSIMCQSCREMVANGQSDAEGFVEVGSLKSYIESRHGKLDSAYDLTDFLDTFGNASNGGGTFESKNIRGATYVRWFPDSDDRNYSQPRSVGAPGQIGSPVTGSAAGRA